MIIGASIINIITESLYDKPIVVFREYVQNSIDAFSKEPEYTNDFLVDISVLEQPLKEDTVVGQNKKYNVFFLDNGSGIAEEVFLDKMRDIAKSEKKKEKDMGYKGIGRLSGISYCERLSFINILDYKNQKFQFYSIDGKKFRNLRNTEDILNENVDSFMDKIGKQYNASQFEKELSEKYVFDFLKEKEVSFNKRNTGFLVVLEGASDVLMQAIQNEHFIEDLSWLLPVRFKDELYADEKYGVLFTGLSEEFISNSLPAKGYPICYHFAEFQQSIIRPISRKSLRSCVYKREFKDRQGNVYAIAFLTFDNNKLVIDRKNLFNGIKIYIDNMLLCDENELLSVLKNLNLTLNTQNELVQTVQSVGVMIYIVDKVSLSANARRTFIDIADNEALDFLRLIRDLISEIYEVRYSLSKYSRGLAQFRDDQTAIQALRDKAISALRELAKEEVELPEESQEMEKTFETMDISEQKKIVKRIILNKINESIKAYFSEVGSLNQETAYEDFKIWLLK